MTSKDLVRIFANCFCGDMFQIYNTLLYYFSDKLMSNINVFGFAVLHKALGDVDCTCIITEHNLVADALSHNYSTFALSIVTVYNSSQMQYILLLLQSEMKFFFLFVPRHKVVSDIEAPIRCAFSVIIVSYQVSITIPNKVFWCL